MAVVSEASPLCPPLMPRRTSRNAFTLQRTAPGFTLLILQRLAWELVPTVGGLSSVRVYSYRFSFSSAICGGVCFYHAHSVRAISGRDSVRVRERARRGRFLLFCHYYFRTCHAGRAGTYFTLERSCTRFLRCKSCSVLRGSSSLPSEDILRLALGVLPRQRRDLCRG